MATTTLPCCSAGGVPQEEEEDRLHGRRRQLHLRELCVLDWRSMAATQKEQS